MLYQFIPCMTLFKDGHQGRFNLKSIKSIRFQIHIILAQICFRWNTELDTI